MHRFPNILIPLSLILASAGCTQQFAELGKLDRSEIGDGLADILPHGEDSQTSDVGELIFESKTPVILDFTATWCGPCKELAPELDLLAKEYKDQAVVAKIDIDDNPVVSKYFKVNSVPTVLVLHNAKIVKRQTGLRPNARIELGQLIEKLNQ